MSSASSKPPKPAGATTATVPWNPIVALLLVVFLLLILPYIVGTLLSLYPLLRHWSEAQTLHWFEQSVTAQALFYVLAAILTVGSVHFFLKLHHRTLRDIGLRRPRWRDLGYGLLAVPVYYVFIFASLIVVGGLFPGLNINQKQEIGFEQVQGTLNLILVFISLVLIPAFMEEILMRGFVYSSLRKIMSVIWAALVTSLIFATAHLHEGGDAGPLYVAALDTFVLSLVLVYLREKTGGLWASMTLHAVKNSVAFVALFLLTKAN